jgi:hypothetical protein
MKSALCRKSRHSREACPRASGQRESTSSGRWTPAFAGVTRRIFISSGGPKAHGNPVKEYNDKVGSIHLNTVREGGNQTRMAERRSALGRAPLAPTSRTKSSRGARKIVVSSPVRAGWVSRPEDGSRPAGSSYDEYGGLSADEQKKRCGLIACPALRDRPRENALRSARTNLIAPSRGRKDADHKSAAPPLG